MEEIIIKVIVDGEEQAPINMGAGKEDSVYEDDIAFFSMGHIKNKEETKAPYNYTIRISRHKAEEE